MNALLAALDLLVLERTSEATFVRRGLLPDWCRRLPAPALAGARPFAIEDAFPFLAAYMEDAERAWSASESARAASGLWTETDVCGEALALEAVAVRVGTARLLVVAHDERLFRQQQLVLQRARELRLAYDALGREIEHKDVLLHAIIHELASPLRELLGSVSWLSEAELNEPAKSRAAAALAAVRRQKQVMSDVLELFSAEHEALPPSLGAAPDLCSAVARVLTELQPVAGRRGVRLSAEPCPSPCPVLGDGRRLLRLLANLVDNALRNSPQGGVVRIAVRRDDGFATVLVDDDGPQIPVAILPRVFETCAPSGPRDQGTGLGLYFCRITLERWGGGIGYEPGPHGGARFWVRLRTAPVQADADARAPRDGAPQVPAAKPLAGPEGRPIEAGTSWEITEPADAAAARERSLSLLEATIEASDDALLVLDRAGRIVLRNRRLSSLWDVSAEQIAAMDGEALLAVMLEQVDDPDGFRAGVLAVEDRPDAESADHVRLKDGRVFERRSRPQRLRGEVVGRVWSFRDVSERERLLTRAMFLADAARLLASLDIEQALAAVARLAVPRLAWCCAIELSLDDGAPRRIAESRDAQLSCEAHPSVRAGRPTLYHVELTSYLGVPIATPAGVAGTLTLGAAPGRTYGDAELELAQELAARTALALENARLYRQAQDAVRARDEFLAVAAHEIRGPIATVQLAVQTLRDDRAPPAARNDNLELIERQDRRLARFVDELLDLSRIRSGALRIDLEEDVDFADVARGVASRLAPELVRSGSHLSLVISGPVRGRWDRLRLEQIVTNLLSNAIKFGRRRPIRLQLAARAGAAELVVADHGPGIAPELHERIFRPFERGVPVRHYGGLGLGLYIVRTIAEAMGGSVNVASAPGRGATFTVRLPQAA